MQIYTFSTPVQATNLKLKPIKTSPAIAFKGNSVNIIPTEVFKGIDKVFSHPQILHVKEVGLLNKLKGKVEEAFFVKLKHENNTKTSLSIFNREGELVSSIEDLDYREYEDYLENPYLTLKRLHSPRNDKYKGAGTKLIQAAVEESLNNNLNGALDLSAGNYLLPSGKSPIPFYLKKGFKFKDPNVTIGKLQEEYRKGRPRMSFEEYLNNNLNEMILTRKAAKKIWLPVISKDPIFEETISNINKPSLLDIYG